MKMIMTRRDRSKVTKVVIALIAGCVFMPSTNAQSKSDRERDGLVGPVKSVQVETALKECKSGEFTEAERATAREEYDLNGRVIGNRNRFATDDPISRMLVYPFDEGIPRIEKPTHKEDGTLIYTDVYTYDNKARRAEHVSYKADGAVQSRSIIVFDAQGGIAESRHYNADGLLASWNVLKRDGRGNVVESSFYKEDGTLVEVERGRCSYLNKFVSTYELDPAGNWVGQTISMPVLRGGRAELVPFITKRRTIAYH